MRTRSHPVSPGGLVSLDDVPALPRRRNTRSVSAQPQDVPEPGLGAAEATKPKPTPKTRKTRSKSTRGKKKDSASIAAEQVGLDDIEMVGSPQVTIVDEPPFSPPSAQLIHEMDLHILNMETASPAGTPIVSIREAAVEVDHPDDLVMQDLNDVSSLESQRLIILYSSIADQFVAKQSHEDRENQDGPTSVIPSIESLHHSVFASVETGDVEDVTAADTAAQFRNFDRRNPRNSPPRASPNAHRASRGSQVLGPQKATPIRRSYSNISQTRRTEASGRINRTLYRLPDLLTQSDSDGEAPAQDRQQAFETQENVSVIANPATPESARLRTPVTPMTAPPAANVSNSAESPNSSPSWSRWIFNNVSRRWTNIREKLVPRPTTETLPAAEVDDIVETEKRIDQVATPIKSTEIISAPVTAPKVPTEALVPLPTRSSYRRRVSTFLPHDVGSDRPRRPRRISTTDRPVAAPKPRQKPTPPAAELGYDLFPRAYDAELLKKWFARGTNPRLVQPSQTTDVTDSTNGAAISAATEASTSKEMVSTSAEDQSLKRKREEPEKIPNPKGCSYGMSEEFFEFTDAEWAEEERRMAALKANEPAQPAAKKQRVDASQSRRRATTRSNTPKASLSALSPARRPGFIPNRRGTYAAPDLSPIDSNGLLSGVESTPITQGSKDETDSAKHACKSIDYETLEEKREKKAKQTLEPKFRPSVPASPSEDPETRDTAPTATPTFETSSATTPERQTAHIGTEIDADADNDIHVDANIEGPSPLTRARNKAEQFKPKTPSRLREAHPFASSIASATTASPSSLGATIDTPLNFGATLQTPTNLRALNSPTVFYSDPMSNETIEPLTPADDANWLRETCPTGDIALLCWPEPASLAETLNIDPAIAEFVNRNSNPGKSAEAAAAWQTMWEEFQRGELEI
ncbi:uncharacterized protein N7477_000371 [Penicillium maclennaniae]|uniref:uncharacterized protein n=1 Tax=Penicillium maclennaniae TaxID=1343394 RepID=UPI002540AA3E|nr:uncharacterized protein N7477_000371 [Penicillium maclennaniae]KAJ5684026.1 hypothetical protein N7477_000371 [Penicillium maclennaniae]